MKDKELTVNIRINGTLTDANLIKRILKLSLPVASEKQQESIKAYIMLIDYAIKRARENAAPT